ncbi:MAG: DUF5668 domain-containing protein [Bryobacteraceae bacterium]|jgi:hypothetical protein
MNCYKHAEAAAMAFCRTCGRPLCQACQRAVQGTIVCEEHAPQTMAPPPPVPAATGTSPGPAFALGIIPGVGAIYNLQYAKGIVHMVIFALLIMLVSSPATDGTGPLFPLLLAIWCIYMPFEAYHTARRRQLGQPVDEFSSIFPLRPYASGFPFGPVALILLGVLFLLHTLGVFSFDQVARWWPLVLIAIGAYMVYCRLTGCGCDRAAVKPEAPPEKR